jgi:N-acetylglucosamine kinase-like BadF-type ATPase
VTGPAAAVLAIDGGNSKTDVVLVGADGSLLSRVRGPSSTPHRLGVDGTFTLLDDLVAQVVAAAGLPPTASPVAEIAAVYLAGADLPSEIDILGTVLRARGWARTAYVENDTFALLRVGADEPDSVAVVCGAGINCCGVAADGRQVRFQALGKISGDWGGGFQLGEEALWSGVRAQDGRGPATTLAQLAPAHFGLRTPMELTEALHFDRLEIERLVELAPLVLAASRDGDPVARSIVERLASEIVLMAESALRQLDLLDRPSTVVLGGGILGAGDEVLLSATTALLAAAVPQATARVVTERPVLGAALAGLDLIGADDDAHQRIRSALGRGALVHRGQLQNPRLRAADESGRTRRVGPHLGA